MNQASEKPNDKQNSEFLRIIRKRWKDGTFQEILDDWKWIFTYSRRYKGAIVFYIFLGIFSTTLGLVGAVASKYVIDIITGAIWAERAWGSYWSWDPKETWSLVTWIIYAIYLHLRLRKGWRGRSAAIFAVVGFICVLFTYLGVNTWLPGVHSYA